MHSFIQPVAPQDNRRLSVVLLKHSSQCIITGASQSASVWLNNESCASDRFRKQKHFQPWVCRKQNKAVLNAANDWRGRGVAALTPRPSRLWCRRSPCWGSSPRSGGLRLWPSLQGDTNTTHPVSSNIIIFIVSLSLTSSSTVWKDKDKRGVDGWIDG